jgi:RNA polymerase sigma-70 factor (ECF subfamily)
MQADPDTRDSDEVLVARFLRGDEAAFDLLVARHRVAIYRLGFRFLGCHEEADDLAQEAFMRAYRSLRGFRGEASFRTWLTRIAINLALKARRSRRATVALEDAPEMQSAAAGPDAALKRQVRQAVGGLPPRQRQILLLKVYEGMKFTEIAQIAGISIGTAKATFFQAVRSLRGRLAPLDGGQGEEA